MPRNSLSHSGCTSSKRSCQPVVLAVLQEADSPEGQRRPAGRGPERIRIKTLQQPLCLSGLVICIHTCSNMDALKLCGYDCYSAIPFDQVFCAQPNSCKVTSPSTLPQPHQPLHLKDTKCFNFHRPRLRELSVKTFRTCQLKTTAFWTIKVFTGISVDAVGLEASCLGSK